MIQIELLEIKNTVFYQEQIKQIHEQNFFKNQGYLMDNDYLEKATHVLIAFEEEKVVGYLSIDINGYTEELDLEHTAFFEPIIFENNILIKQFAIEKKYQNQGIGKNMIRKLKAYGIGHHYTCIYLFMWSANKKAHSFYTKNGFVHCGTWSVDTYKGIKPFSSYIFSYNL